MNVKIDSLYKSFGNNHVVDNVSFAINDGELVTLLGPSGCGKTTVLRVLAGLEQPTSGTVRVGEKVFNDATHATPPHQRGIGMVFQSYALWPHRTVFENVSFPLEIRKLAASERASKIAQALKLVDLGELGHRYPHELSGGQQQRVALARAIAQQPTVLLLDEPLSNLDAKLREQMRGDLKALQQSLKLTMLYVTHDRLEALELSHRMAIMDHGKLVQMGTPDEIRENPVNDFVRHFIS
ncbi:MAG: ABC transporter ATP-binding protein [Deltaproteobacteria bacterium]|nr:ABC transporter ATP-binding protein [Deltaproteobacteria bacterium]